MDEILASIRRILAEDESAPIRPPGRLRPGSEDVLDLTEALNDDGSLRHIEPLKVVAPKPRQAEPRPAEPRPAEPRPDGRIEPAAPRPDLPADAPQLVSSAAAEAVSASFARLSSLPRAGDKSLDELVQAALRPLLQAWLDEHLPGLVERLVRAEIARVVGGRPLAP